VADRDGEGGRGGCRQDVAGAERRRASHRHHRHRHLEIGSPRKWVRVRDSARGGRRRSDDAELRTVGVGPTCSDSRVTF
jgi:hypothetical protein